jgi:rod shape-determining protein MreC
MVRRGTQLPEVVYRKHSPLVSADPSPWVRQPTRYLPLFLLLVVLSCVVIAIDLRYGFGWVKTSLGNLAGPIVHSVDLLITPLSRSASFIEETLQAKSENQQLRERIADLEQQVRTGQDAVEENRRLRELLDLKADIAPKAIAAQVIRYHAGVAGKTMTLRRNEEMKISPFAVGQPVLTRGGQLLGRIIAVYQRFSTVRLIHDPASSMGVTLEKSQSQGILYNRGSSLYVKVDRNELVSPNEKVFTSHLSDLFPEGLLIGVIAGEADPREKDPLVAAELGLMKSYVVNPIYPLDQWSGIREVLCLPLWQISEPSSQPLTQKEEGSQS